MANTSLQTTSQKHTTFPLLSHSHQTRLLSLKHCIERKTLKQITLSALSYQHDPMESLYSMPSCLFPVSFGILSNNLGSEIVSILSGVAEEIQF